MCWSFLLGALRCTRTTATYFCSCSRCWRTGDWKLRWMGWSGKPKAPQLNNSTRLQGCASLQRGASVRLVACLRSVGGKTVVDGQTKSVKNLNLKRYGIRCVLLSPWPISRCGRNTGPAFTKRCTSLLVRLSCCGLVSRRTFVVWTNGISFLRVPSQDTPCSSSTTKRSTLPPPGHPPQIYYNSPRRHSLGVSCFQDSRRKPFGGACVCPWQCLQYCIHVRDERRGALYAPVFIHAVAVAVWLEVFGGAKAPRIERLCSEHHFMFLLNAREENFFMCLLLLRGIRRQNCRCIKILSSLKRFHFVLPIFLHAFFCAFE